MIPKLRAWDKKNRRWFATGRLEYLCVCDSLAVLVTYKPNNQGGYSPSSMVQLTNDEFDNLIFEQSTGIKDENNIEIFDGDILEFEAKEWGAEPPNNYLVVGWNKYSGWEAGGVSREWEEWCKVIGNIHENQELLK